MYSLKKFLIIHEISEKSFPNENKKIVSICQQFLYVYRSFAQLFVYTIYHAVGFHKTGR